MTQQQVDLTVITPRTREGSIKGIHFYNHAKKQRKRNQTQFQKRGDGKLSGESSNGEIIQQILQKVESVYQSLARKSNWKVLKGNTVGGEIEKDEREVRWRLEESDWSKFAIISEGKSWTLEVVDVNQWVNELNSEIGRIV